MTAEVQISSILNKVMKIDAVEEAFSLYIVHKNETRGQKYATISEDLKKVFSSLNAEQQEVGVKHFLLLTAETSNLSRLQLLLSLLEQLVVESVLPARMVCEAIMTCEKLQYQRQNFWVECFKLISKILSGVDYKGVRSVMKSCKEKAQSIPADLNASIAPQLKALMDVLELIFDRNACLLPGYFIVTEIQKAYPNNTNWPHWKLAKLLSSFVEGFRPLAQMISIIGRSKMLPIVEHSGGGQDNLNTSWLLDTSTLKLTFKGNLPYEKDLLEPQTKLLRYVLEQPYSRDMVCLMLGLTKQMKQRCLALEEQMVELMVAAMEKSEEEPVQMEVSTEENTLSSASHLLWQHLSSQLIYFVLFQFASFPDIVSALHKKLAEKDLKKGRDHLMWVLLQYISGSIQRNTLNTLLPVLCLCDFLYPEKDPLPVPDYNEPISSRQLAATSIWIHLLKKAQTENKDIQRPVPNAFKNHHEFLQHLVLSNNTQLTMGSDYRIAILCNAYSTNQDYFTRPMAALVETIFGSQKPGQTPIATPSGMSNGPTTPLSMEVLDSLTVHSKMSLIHSIGTHVVKLAQSKSHLPLAPALVETYSRLLVYTEIETLGIKAFISQLLPSVFKSHAWGILYTLLEMFSYRMHHIQPHYRVQLLSHLHSLAAVPQTNQVQLHLCVESTALRLITGLGSTEVQPQLSRFTGEPQVLVSVESEELNRAFVLTLARAIHVTRSGYESLSGTWYKTVLKAIMTNTPHSWANHTLACFPPALNEFFQTNTVQKENKQQLKKAVEEEYRNWASMTNENDIIAHFTVQGTPPLFLCLLWKMILETDRISPIAYKILERIGARPLSAHLRKFCDYLVYEFANSGGGQHVNKCVDAINDMMWKYNIITIDRLVLCLALRTQEGSEAQVCFFIIQLLLLKAAEFRNRVQEFVKENSPEHWKQSNWHEKHLAYHRKYPERFAPDGNMDQAGGNSSSVYNTLPVYFGNVCLRFLPVFDIVIHRFLEIPPIIKSLETLLEHLGCLYKFHDRPISYLYNTLHYFEHKLRDKASLRRRLVSAVIGSLRDIRPSGWSLSEPYQNYLRQTDDKPWNPELDYYIHLVERVVDTLNGKPPIPPTDWRFNEFPNAGAHILYVTCVELMAVPATPSVVAGFLLDVVFKGYPMIPVKDMELWINAVGQVLAALPDAYWNEHHIRLTQILESMKVWNYRNTPFQLFNFKECHDGLLENKFAYSLAVAHSLWHHSGVGQMSFFPRFIKEHIQPHVQNEEQLLFACHLIGPFLQRCKPEQLFEVTVCLREMLEQVDKPGDQLKYMDPVCDLFYHIKYMYLGDMMKSEVEGIFRKLSPALQVRLRFIAHLNPDENTATGAASTPAAVTPTASAPVSTNPPPGPVN
ncbi:mediator of RNA polymerase II transcription subunit 23 isoform X2 [Neocloeon triangulifer]|uniref:mediator of RNA polymerase II transcription subunit 23 isoform X2 n=1 Tax=Neocloeon triangulifer TaxID=2078957 RepID=UPI00286FABC3|nr:mediator of RNA polymerase II transcription subunit 23 isoform X2 [Neocloeon triangulifer]